MEAYFSKVGIIEQDFLKGGPRIKLYKTPEGRLKGDGLVTFHQPASVQLALDLLDEWHLRPHVLIRVSIPQYDASRKNGSHSSSGAASGSGGGDDASASMLPASFSKPKQKLTRMEKLKIENNKKQFAKSRLFFFLSLR